MRPNPPRPHPDRNSLPRRTAGLAALALAASFLAASPGAASADPTPTPTETRTAADSTAAVRQQAKQAGKRIEIEEYRSETTTVYANPDGKSLYAEVHSMPIRVRKNGAWQNIDTTLVEKDGVITPKAAIGDLTLTTGGDTTLATVTNEKGKARIFAPGKLPKPVLKDNTATYPNAYGKGVDLIVTAVPTGFHQEIVFRQRPTGKPKLKVGVDLPKGMRYGKDSTGKPALLAEKAADGAKDKPTEQATALTPALLMDATAKERPDMGRTADATIKIGKDGDNPALELAPDSEFLADPATTYPVTLAAASDEWYGAGRQDDTFVNNAAYPSGAANAGLNRILVGKSNSGSVTWRGYIRFDIASSPLMGGTVLNADLRLWNYRANTCNWQIESGILVRKITSNWNVNNLTWSNQPSTTSSGQYGNKGAYSDDCPNGEGELYYSIEDITQSWMNGDPDYGVQLRAVSESDITNWRWYRSFDYGGYNGGTGTPRGPVLFVNYEPAPTEEVGTFQYGEFQETESDIRAAKARETDTEHHPFSIPTDEQAHEAALNSDERSFVDVSALQPPSDLTDEELQWELEDTGPGYDESEDAPSDDPDTSAPSVLTNPGPGESDVPADVKIRIAFTEPVTGPQFRLLNASNDEVTVTTTQTDTEGQGWELAPAQELTAGETYRIEVKAAQDAAGNVMADYTSSFTVRGATPNPGESPTPGPTDPPGEEHTITLPVQTDIWIDNSGYSDRWGDTLWTGAWEYDSEKVRERIYLKFDTGALAGKTVTAATLRLFNTDAYGCGTQSSGIRVQQVTSPWNPTTLRWNNQPSTTSVGETTTGDPTRCTGAPVTGRTWNWTITAIAQGWASGQADNGLLLRGVDESPSAPEYDRGFASSRATVASQRPVLTVTYVEGSGSTPAPNPTPTPTEDDTTPPTVLEVDPPDGTIVPGDSTVTVRFDEPVTGARLTVMDLIMEEPVPGSTTMSADGKVLTFTPDEELWSYYEAEVSGATDAAGNTLSEPYYWYFAAEGILGVAGRKPAADLAGTDRTAAEKATGAAPTVGRLRVRGSDDSAGRTTVSTDRPHLMATVDDKLGRTSTVEVEVARDQTRSGQGGDTIWTGKVRDVPAGAAADIRVPDGKLQPGQIVRWRARATTGRSQGKWSDWQTLEIAEGAQRSAARMAASADTRVDQCWQNFSKANSKVSDGYAIDRKNWCAIQNIAHLVVGFRTSGMTGWATILGQGLSSGKNNTKQRFTQYELSMKEIYALGSWASGGRLAFGVSTEGTTCKISGSKYVEGHWTEWKNGKTATFRVWSDEANGVGEDKIEFCHPKFYTKLWPGGTSPPNYYWSDAKPQARCDSAPYIASTRGGGCVYNTIWPVYETTETLPGAPWDGTTAPDNVQTSYRNVPGHIWTALYRTHLTKPIFPNKNIPGHHVRGPQLTRNVRKTWRNKNNQKVRKLCNLLFPDFRRTDPVLGKPAEKDGVPVPPEDRLVYECDEYPFESTMQGAWTSAERIKQPGNMGFSIRPVWWRHNGADGNRLSLFYRDQRILGVDGKKRLGVADGFFVQAKAPGYLP